MISFRPNARILFHLICTILLTTVLNCGDEVTNPGGDSGGTNDTTGPEIDVTSPQSISRLSMIYSLDNRAAYLEWPAPYDDSLSEAVSRYIIKFTYTDPFIWDLAIPALDPPVPSAPGEIEQYTIRYPLRGRNLFAAIRSVDEAGNISAISDIGMVQIPGYTISGRCLNAMDDQPIEGLAVTLATGGIHHAVTDSDGRYEISNLSGGAAAITISTGSADFPCHTLQQNFELAEDLQRTEFIIPVIPTESPHFENLLSFFKYLTRSFAPSIIKSWKRRPIKCYIPAFVNSAGVDYESGSRSAAQRWMDKTGIALFTFVDQPPDTGITLHYKPRSEMGIQIAITRPTIGDDGHPLRMDIEIAKDFTADNDIYLVMVHEFGHTLQFGHLPYSEFIMYVGGNLPQDISSDEVLATRLLVALPSTIDMAIYDESNP